MAVVPRRGRRAMKPPPPPALVARGSGRPCPAGLQVRQSGGGGCGEEVEKEMGAPLSARYQLRALAWAGRRLLHQVAHLRRHLALCGVHKRTSASHPHDVPSTPVTPQSKSTAQLQLPTHPILPPPPAHCHPILGSLKISQRVRVHWALSAGKGLHLRGRLSNCCTASVTAG